MECVDTFMRFAVTLPILSVVSGAMLLTALMLPDPGFLMRPPVPQLGLAAGFVFSAVIANLIAPRMRIRTWGRKGWAKGDRLSG